MRLASVDSAPMITRHVLVIDGFGVGMPDAGDMAMPGSHTLSIWPMPLGLNVPT